MRTPEQLVAEFEAVSKVKRGRCEHRRWLLEVPLMTEAIAWRCVAHSLAQLSDIEEPAVLQEYGRHLMAVRRVARCHLEADDVSDESKIEVQVLVEHMDGQRENYRTRVMDSGIWPNAALERLRAEGSIGESDLVIRVWRVEEDVDEPVRAGENAAPSKEA